MTLLGRDVGEIEALVTDRYLDALLSGRDRGSAIDAGQGRPARGRSRGAAGLDDAVRLVSRRLADDLPRFHPSFRFEERLALQLAEAAAAMRLPVAAGSERTAMPVPAPLGHVELDPTAAPFEDDDTADPDGQLSRPVLIGGAVAASAISLAGAWLAWRRRGSGAPFARAARAAHALRPSEARAPRRQVRRPLGG